MLRIFSSVKYENIGDDIFISIRSYGFDEQCR